MAADYAHLEARVHELEQQMRHILPSKIDAIGYGVSVMHGEMTAVLGDHGERLSRIELQLERQGEQLGTHGELLANQGDQLDRHGAMLAEILRRLPADPE